MNSQERRQAIRKGLARVDFCVSMCGERAVGCISNKRQTGCAAVAEFRETEFNHIRTDLSLAFLHDNGAVLKTEGALPEVDDAYKDFGGNDSIWEDSQQAMVDAGYTRTAPLIEPEKPH